MNYDYVFHVDVPNDRGGCDHDLNDHGHDDCGSVLQLRKAGQQVLELPKIQILYFSYLIYLFSCNTRASQILTIISNTVLLLESLKICLTYWDYKYWLLGAN